MNKQGKNNNRRLPKNKSIKSKWWLLNWISQHETWSLEPVIQQTSSDGWRLMITKEGIFPNRTSFFRQTTNAPMPKSTRCRVSWALPDSEMFHEPPLQTLSGKRPTRPNQLVLIPVFFCLPRWSVAQQMERQKEGTPQLVWEPGHRITQLFTPTFSLAKKKAFGHSQSVLQCVPGKRSGVKKEKNM